MTSFLRSTRPAFNFYYGAIDKIRVSQRIVSRTVIPYTVRNYARPPGTVLRKTQELLVRLTPSERAVLLRELRAYENACSSSPSKDGTTLNNSSTGSDGLLNGSQLRLVALASAIPFVGFGFLDNFIMIVAGDYIDYKLGATLAISTMAAAALGNLISDIAGVGSAWYVESLSSKIGVVAPILTPAQLAMPSTTWSIYLGRAIGVTIGCLLGMFPLLFLPEKKTENRE